MHALLKNQRMPPVVLIEGTRQVTHEFLEKWAKMSACRDFSACGVCEGCLLFAHDNHPDIIHLKPHQIGHAIKIDQVRELQQQCIHTPQIMSMMMVLIECADHLNDFAANALLKLFEEPSGAVYFILSAENTSRLPKTILSRCWQFHIQDGLPLDLNTASHYLLAEEPKQQLLQQYVKWTHLIQDYCQRQIDTSRIVAYLEVYPLDDVLWFLQFFTLKIIEILQSKCSNRPVEWIIAVSIPIEIWWQFWDALIQLRKQLRVQSSVQTNLQLTRLLLILHGYR